MNRLIVRGIDGTQQDYPLPEGILMIGRDPACGVHLNDPQVSWKHAQLTAARGAYVVEDLHSTNGTFVAAQRIRRQSLRSGDKIKIGPYELAVHISASPDSASERTLFAAERHDSPPASRPLRHALMSAVEQPALTTPAGHRWRASLGRWLPVVDWSARYQKEDLRHELIAGVTVAAMTVPQGMAYALLAGLPPVMGLYASILPMIVYALTGSGRQTSLGPVALDSIMVAVGLSVWAAAGSASYVALAILLAALVGAIQLGMGVLRLGFLVNFLSYPVLAGFTAAAAVIIAVSQVQHLVGIHLPSSPAFYQVLRGTWERIPDANVVTLLLGIGGIFILLSVKRWASAAPGPLGLMALGTVLAYALDLNAQGVQVVGAVPAGLPSLNVPDLHWAEVRQLLPLALTMALVGFAQTISIGKSLGNKYGYDIDANQELGALGLANLCSSLSHGYSVSGGLSRSAVNAKAGAKTPLAAIFAALCVGLTALYLTPLFHYLPKAALAAIIVVSALGLIDTREIRYLFKVKITEGVLLVFTFAVTLAVGITWGLLLGVVASILLFITLNTRPHAALLGRLPHTNIFRNIDNFEEAETTPGLVILRIDASLYFANAVFLKEKIREVCEQDQGRLKAFILDASAVNDLDSSADTALHQLCDEFKRRGITFYIAGVKAPVREVMRRSGLYDVLGGDHFFFTIDAAVKRFQEKQGAPVSDSL